MKTIRNLLFAGLAVSMLSACGTSDDAEIQTADETETFRQGLPSAADLQMEYAPEGSANALAGQLSMVAGLTAEAVVGTNAFMIGHFAMMRQIAALPPTESSPNHRAWQGDNEGLTMRVVANRSLTPRGTKYDYVVAGKPAGSTQAFKPIIDGHVVRLDEQYQPRDGFGIVRFHFDNLNDLKPGEQVDGKVRVAFRKANRAHQVHVRAINVVTKEDPNFPQAAEYVYAVRPDSSGAMRWYSRGDVLNDDQPLENVAVHSAWRADKSGIGSAVVFGGSLDVDYWHLVECWGSNFVKGYDVVETPDARTESGDASTCFITPSDAPEPPAFDENVPDEDPEIPAAMPEEEDGN